MNPECLELALTPVRGPPLQVTSQVWNLRQTSALWNRFDLQFVCSRNWPCLQASVEASPLCSGTGHCSHCLFCCSSGSTVFSAAVPFVISLPWAHMLSCCPLSCPGLLSPSWDILVPNEVNLQWGWAETESPLYSWELVSFIYSSLAGRMFCGVTCPFTL